MQQGLEIWNEAGNLMLSLTDRVGVVSGQVDTNGTSGSVTVTGLDSSSRLFYSNLTYGYDVSTDRYLSLSVSGRTISWSYVATAGTQTVNRNAKIIFGAW